MKHVNIFHWFFADFSKIIPWMPLRAAFGEVVSANNRKSANGTSLYQTPALSQTMTVVKQEWPSTFGEVMRSWESFGDFSPTDYHFCASYPENCHKIYEQQNCVCVNNGRVATKSAMRTPYSFGVKSGFFWNCSCNFLYFSLLGDRFRRLIHFYRLRDWPYLTYLLMAIDNGKLIITRGGFFFKLEYMHAIKRILGTLTTRMNQKKLETKKCRHQPEIIKKQPKEDSNIRIHNLISRLRSAMAKKCLPIKMGWIFLKVTLDVVISYKQSIRSYKN